jgi:acid phosphatase family membrane protein YuiD
MASDPRLLWQNDALWLPIFAGALVQLVKFLGHWFRHRRPDFLVLIQAGGMPSSHAAMVCALATAIGFREGFGSSAFAIAAVLAIIVMYDAAGVRQAASRQARVLNRIIDELFQGHPISEERLRELIGHTPFEVIVGAAIGVAVAWFSVSWRGP